MPFPATNPTAVLLAGAGAGEIVNGAGVGVVDGFGEWVGGVEAGAGLWLGDWTTIVTFSPLPQLPVAPLMK